MLLTVGNDYDAELQELMQGLKAAINPVMTFVLVGIVGFIMVSILLPIMSMGDLAGI
jgi:type II secretory pathway component PulF